MSIKKILTVILLTSTFSTVYSSIKNQSYTSIITNNEENRNFEEDYKTAHEWGKEQWKKWGGELTREEAVSLQEYVNGSRAINQYLRRKEGAVPKDSSSALLEKIHNIDQALEKGKIPESIYVYRRVRESMFGLANDRLRNEKSFNKEINEAVFNEVKAQHENKDFIEYGFLSTSLVKNPTEQFNAASHSILLQIKVPHGLNGAYISGRMNNAYEAEILIARGYTIKYESFSKIVERGYHIVKIEASLRNNAF